MTTEELSAAQATLRSHRSTITGLKDRIARSQEEIDALEKECAALQPQVEEAEKAALAAQLAAAKKGDK